MQHVELVRRVDIHYFDEDINHLEDQCDLPRDQLLIAICVRVDLLGLAVDAYIIVKIRVENFLLA